jgi:4-amino-4-deoxy-L-arabinose transferase-like glycosyltransferase
MASRNISSLTYLLLGLAFVYANSLINHGLIPSMEPRFAQVISEMMTAGQFLVPIKNDIPYVEYPPLLYWLAIIPAKLGLPIEAAIRLPCYIAFIFWVLYLDKLQVLFWKKWPKHLMALVGAALPAILWHFFIAQTDALLITGVLIAFVGFAEVRLGCSDKRFPWSLWLGVALATAAKGPVGIACTLPPMVLEILLSAGLSPHSGSTRSLLLKRFARQLMSMAWARGLALLGLTIIPWYALTAYFHGWDFVRAVVVYQNFERYLTGFDHLQPWWYYFGSVLAGMFPVSLLVPFGLWAAVRRLSLLPERLVLIWAVYSFLFFSLSASKQGKYILPAAPAFLALGLVGGEAIFKNSLERVLGFLRRWAVALLVVWGIAVIAVLPFYSSKIAHIGGFEVIRNTIAKQPGKIVHYQWPRSLSLYELGSPMDYVRSSRELYGNIKTGKIVPGDYLLVGEKYMNQADDPTQTGQLIPPPTEPWFEHVLSIKAEKRMQLFRVLPGAGLLDSPPTPEPEELNWRDARFDTD